MYTLKHNNNEDIEVKVTTLEEARQELRDFYKLSMTMLNDNDPKLEDDFLYYSESKYKSIDSMNYEELKEEFDRFDWALETI
jgi:hypothetical protein